MRLSYLTVAQFPYSQGSRDTIQAIYNGSISYEKAMSNFCHTLYANVHLSTPKEYILANIKPTERHGGVHNTVINSRKISLCIYCGDTEIDRSLRCVLLQRRDLVLSWS